MLCVTDLDRDRPDRSAIPAGKSADRLVQRLKLTVPPFRCGREEGDELAVAIRVAECRVFEEERERSSVTGVGVRSLRMPDALAPSYHSLRHDQAMPPPTRSVLRRDVPGSSRRSTS